MERLRNIIRSEPKTSHQSNNILVESVTDAIALSRQRTGPLEIILKNSSQITDTPEATSSSSQPNVSEMSAIKKETETNKEINEKSKATVEAINDPHIFTIPESADNQTAETIIANFLNQPIPTSSERPFVEKEETQKRIFGKTIFERLPVARRLTPARR